MTDALELMLKRTMKKRKEEIAKLPIKDGVLICRREEQKGRVTIWAAADPNLSAESVSLEKAQALLLQKVYV